MLEELKQRVMEANKRLKSDHLVISHGEMYRNTMKRQGLWRLRQAA